MGYTLYYMYLAIVKPTGKCRYAFLKFTYHIYKLTGMLYGISGVITQRDNRRIVSCYLFFF